MSHVVIASMWDVPHLTPRMRDMLLSNFLTEEQKARFTGVPPAFKWALENPAEIDSLLKRRKLYDYYPSEGPLRRELYAKHMEFFEAGSIHRERLFLAANRVGKTEGAGGFETTLHLTGKYPDWWEGRRFDRPISAVVAGDTSKTVRDIIQKKLCGSPGQIGTGLIPGDSIVKTTARAGISDALDSVIVKHPAGESRLLFRSYEQGREAFQGDEQDVVWLDEEPPMSVYGECLMRTMTTNGIVMLTFTPLNGWSDVVRAFLDTEPSA